MAPCDEVSSCISNPTSPATMVNSDEGVVTVAVSGKLQKGQSPDMNIQGLESNKEASAPSIISQKTSQGPNNADTALQSDKGHISSVKPENVLQSSCTGVLALVPSQEGRTPSVIPKKAPQTPNSSVHPLPSCHEGSIHPVVRGSDDGFNWRKYGQKNVKGNEYIRSYYKCTYPNCQVKRQVERSHDGQITDTVYFGQHDHPKPQANIPLAVGFVVSIVNERSAEPSVTSPNDKLCNVDVKSPIKKEHIAVATSDDVKSVFSQSNRRANEIDNHDVPDSKRHKKNNLDAKSVDRSTTEQRVVKTVSEVDSVNDGYRWRKYGQKLVKGNPNPRSYYRCSSPGCPAKKHVERASHDPKTVIATYEGQHDHDMPLGRTATHSTAPLDKETGTKSRKNNAACLEMVLHVSSDPLGTSPGSEAREILQIESGPVNKADEQQNGESGNKSEARDAVSLNNMAAQPSLGNGNQSNKVKNIHLTAKAEETEMIGPATEGPEARSNGKPEGINNLSTGSISKEQPTPNAELLHTENPSKVLQNDEAD